MLVCTHPVFKAVSPVFSISLLQILRFSCKIEVSIYLAFQSGDKPRSCIYFFVLPTSFDNVLGITLPQRPSVHRGRAGVGAALI